MVREPSGALQIESKPCVGVHLLGVAVQVGYKNWPPTAFCTTAQFLRFKTEIQERSANMRAGIFACLLAVFHHTVGEFQIRLFGSSSSVALARAVCHGVGVC